jgi:phage FluMu protein Com
MAVPDKTHTCVKCGAWMIGYGFSGYFVYECPVCGGKAYPSNKVERPKKVILEKEGDKVSYRGEP